MSMTIGETASQLHLALKDYIEATYHVSHPTLVEQRQRILDEPGVIHQRPYLESTPRYKTGDAFRELGLDAATVDALAAVSGEQGGLNRIIHDPPYQHQADATKLALVDGRSLVVMTGTGSGKTECFLLPVLGKLAREAHKKGREFGDTPAMRALILYPMNALVNDQLGRLRLLFGDQRIVAKFMDWSGRPARFARYTSRTLYAGVRDPKKDQHRLAPFGKYYVDTLLRAQGPPSEEQTQAALLVAELKQRGKWPAKPDLVNWYGTKGSRWRDQKTGVFKRCVTLADDPELLTRHEVQQAPPDILVTNYSMLEYMLLRPLERPIFEHTREWLRANPDERFLLVVDEAHLYKGAAGAEVALLIRRLRMRLGIPPERLQVICTSASFQDSQAALEFGAQLTGKDPSDFRTVQGDLLHRAGDASGTLDDATALEAIDLGEFYKSDTEQGRLSQVEGFLSYRGVAAPHQLQRSLYDALVSFAPMARLINLTMTEARPVNSIGDALFEGVPSDLAARAVTTLIAMGSIARPDPTSPGLLPCRVHSFFRGLAGLWACMDPQCSALTPEKRGGPTGRLFSQPRDTCDCGSRVLELYTCRHCGTAYCRAYTDNVEEPDFLWAEPGSTFRTASGEYEEFSPLDLLLEAPVFDERVEPAEYDLETGRLNPPRLGPRSRPIYLRAERYRPIQSSGSKGAQPGEFRPCAVCGEQAAFGRTPVQDHQTKGDQPFQALIARQIEVQPPSPVKATRMAPLRGRKVLIFSDSRQTAARLAPNLQKYSTQDALRPLIIHGFNRLKDSPTVTPHLSLEDLYLAVLIGAKAMGVRLRPELRVAESFQDEIRVEEAIKSGVLDSPADLLALLIDIRSSSPPASLLRGIADSLSDRYYGLEALALASIVEKPTHTSKIVDLPEIPNFVQSDAEKLVMARNWLRCWKRYGFWLGHMPQAWWLNEIRPHSGKFSAMERIVNTKQSKSIFNKQWLPVLLKLFTERISAGKHRLRGTEVSLETDGLWAYCQSCRTAQRPYGERAKCVNCGQETAISIDPDADPVFVARKGYYRKSTIDALKSPPVPPISLIAAEHTAQLNTAQQEEVFSKAEEYELLFQDVNLGPEDSGRDRPAIDALSCTTTMEVGIDIGALSGVSLRNMPPARANYQQRAGRAGRRGNAVATVTAFGSADSHDEHYFEKPDLMIRGAVDDPTLTLQNREIARRHVTAFLLQRYHHAKLPEIRPDAQPQLFAVLGTVSDFRNPDRTLNRSDLEQWLRSNESALQDEVAEWLPTEIDPQDRQALLKELIDGTLGPIDEAIDYTPTVAANPSASEDDSTPSISVEVQVEPGEEQSSQEVASENLLDRLLYKGVIPRYAFPTDVATFHVFDQDRSSSYRPAFRFTPSQGLSVALSQYAPGKEVWIDNKLWTSGAIYSPISDDRFNAWKHRKLYYECTFCHYSETTSLDDGERGETRDCEACGSTGTLGPASYWMRPPGFAHPVTTEEGTSPDDQPARSYATRAKLRMPSPTDRAKWTRLSDQIRICDLRGPLLVTNRGPRERGYTYCTRCGRIEPSVLPEGIVAGVHKKPYPDDRNQNCDGGQTSTGLMLGTDFISDVLIASISVTPPLTLAPGNLSTEIALRTVAEALAKAACAMLQLESSELQAEFRPALTPAGRAGQEAEIYLYDTLPGGAGFAQRAGRLGISVFERALQILESCPEGCDRSCYRCLRSYKNKFEHDLLDRHLGAVLLKFLIEGRYADLDAARVESSTDLLFEDLHRQDLSSVSIARSHSIEVPEFGTLTAPIYLRRQGTGSELIVGIHGPLTPDDPTDSALRDFMNSSSGVPVLLIDEILVRRNLPAATERLISEI